MHLLYLDESGSVSDPKQIFFVLAGISVFERQCYWIGNELDKIAARFDPAQPTSIELHGSPMYHGKGSLWRKFKPEERRQAIKDALSVFAESNPHNVMFACVVRKSIVGIRDPVELAFEQLASRFDYYLARRYKKYSDNQRGIIIFDKSTYETAIQKLAADFRTIGHSWGILKNFSEVPMFIDSRASRLIQLADLVAYAIFRHYEARDDQFYSIIKRRWDTDGGQLHGLFEKINPS